MTTPNWPSDWCTQLSQESRLVFETELQRELTPGHILTGHQVRVIAQRIDCDDFIFLLDDGRVALVHLTWQKESNPDWPHATIETDLNVLLAALED